MVIMGWDIYHESWRGIMIMIGWVLDIYYDTWRGIMILMG